jgi:putative hydrolase of the HAD superfamily
MSRRAVVFDLFGTLIDDSTPAEYAVLLRNVADGLGVDPDAFAVAWSRHDIARYTRPLAECFAAVCADVGVSYAKRMETALERRREHLRRILVPGPMRCRRWPELRSRGFARDDLERERRAVGAVGRVGVRRLFDAALFSADGDDDEPDPRIYRRMTELLGVEPEHCTFVGDGAYRELQGASEVGMTAVLIRVPHDEWEHDGTIGWTGPRVSSLSEVLALV